MTTFQRARSEQAREIRRQAILDTAAQMLTEMPASDITLNELSRRSRLAKSGFLKYFESREAVLLELLDRAWKQWTAEIADELAAGTDTTQPAQRRGADFAATLTRTLAAPTPNYVICSALKPASWSTTCPPAWSTATRGPPSPTSQPLPN